MKEKNPEIEQLRAFMVGMQSAFGATLGAIIRTHPDPVALNQMLQIYHQREQAYLENQSVPENVLDLFQKMWKRVDADIQHTLKHDQQQPPPLE